MDWSIKITKTNNGYYLQPSEEAEGRDKVIQIDEDINCETRAEQLAFQELAYELMDFFAVNNDKHANNGKGQFLRIEVD